MSNIGIISIILVIVIPLYAYGVYMNEDKDISPSVNASSLLTSESGSYWGASIPVIGGIFTLIGEIIDIVKIVFTGIPLIAEILPNNFVWGLFSIIAIISAYRLIWGR